MAVVDNRRRLRPRLYPDWVSGIGALRLVLAGTVVAVLLVMMSAMWEQVPGRHAPPPLAPSLVSGSTGGRGPTHAMPVATSTRVAHPIKGTIDGSAAGERSAPAASRGMIQRQLPGCCSDGTDRSACFSEYVCVDGPGGRRVSSALHTTRDSSGGKRRSPTRDDATPSQEAASSSFVGGADVYGFTVINRTCYYRNVVVADVTSSATYFTVYLRPGTAAPPPVSLASRGYDLPIMHWKRKRLRAKMNPTMEWAPNVVFGPVPCDRVTIAQSAAAASAVATNSQQKVGGDAQGQQAANSSSATGKPPVSSSASVTLAYYSPIVAPWNFAHTLLCDLFGLFWGAQEVGVSALGLQLVAVSRIFYPPEFPLPNSNKAFDWFSFRRPVYDRSLTPHTLYGGLLVGTGTKTWSWVLPTYAASGSADMWFAFRQHIIDTVGATANEEDDDGKGSGIDASRIILRSAGEKSLQKAPPLSRRLERSPLPSTSHKRQVVRVSICHKKDKRGVVNYDEAVEMLRGHFGANWSEANGDATGGDRPRVEFHLESQVGKSAREQVEMMLRRHVYICNEGTLATTFFLMKPGSVFLSIPLVYHAPHMHIRQMPSETTWWAEPDLMRPDPRKNIGGNIDWFPPAISWVTPIWYDTVPLNETRIQLPIRSLRNYMPEFNVVLRRERLIPLVMRAVGMIVQSSRPPAMAQDAPPPAPTGNDASAREGAVSSPFHAPLSPPHGYSTTANLCRQVLSKRPELATAFNSARCFYGMSWLCEFWSNTAPRYRMLHEKWSLSKGRCGDAKTHPAALGIADPRDRLSLSEFLFYQRDYAQTRYGATDLGLSNTSVPELDAVFHAFEIQKNGNGDRHLDPAHPEAVMGERGGGTGRERSETVVDAVEATSSSSATAHPGEAPSQGGNLDVPIH